jgi:hypothetical protein
MQNAPELQRRAAFVRRLAGATAIALIALIAAERLSPPLMAAWTPGGIDAAALAAGVVRLLPALAFTWALWALRQGFAGVASGQAFTNELPRALAHAGWALIAGALAATIVEPVLLSALGRGPGYIVALDAGAIATGAVGAGLVALASLLREAVAMKSELEGFM